MGLLDQKQQSSMPKRVCVEAEQEAAISILDDCANPGFRQRNSSEGTSGFNKGGSLGAPEPQNEQTNADSISKRFVLKF